MQGLTTTQTRTHARTHTIHTHTQYTYIHTYAHTHIYRYISPLKETYVEVPGVNKMLEDDVRGVAWLPVITLPCLFSNPGVPSLGEEPESCL